MKRYLCILVLAALAGLVAWIAPAFIPARAQGSGPNRCKSNLKNIGTALEMYSTDFSGHYPSSLVRLTPNYLRIVPMCPSAGRDTYSAAYRRGVDTYTVFCSGLNHEDMGISTPNYPQYNSQQGLVERP